MAEAQDRILASAQTEQLHQTGHQGHDQGRQQKHQGQQVQDQHIDGQRASPPQVSRHGDGLVDGGPTHAGAGLMQAMDLTHRPVDHVLLVVVGQGRAGPGLISQTQHMVGDRVGTHSDVLVARGVGLGEHALHPLHLGGHDILGPVGQQGGNGIGAAVGGVDVQIIQAQEGGIGAEEPTDHRLVALVGSGNGEILGYEEAHGVPRRIDHGAQQDLEGDPAVHGQQHGGDPSALAGGIDAYLGCIHISPVAQQIGNPLVGLGRGGIVPVGIIGGPDRLVQHGGDETGRGQGSGHIPEGVVAGAVTGAVHEDYGWPMP